MKKFFTGFIKITPLVLLLISGCELTTPPGPPPRGKLVGNDLVLNEVFTISPDKYYAYSWIELFNPTDHPVPWVDDVYPINTYALGSSGTLIHAEELDVNSWEVAIPGNTQTYNNLDFYFPDTAFACGNSGLLQKFKRDTLGGFTVENLSAGTSKNINDCQFGYLNQVGYLVCDGGEIRRSLNRGASWTLQTSGVTTNLHSISFIDFGNPPRIWTCGDSGTVLRKAGGSSWTKQVLPADKTTMAFYGMAFTVDTTIEHGLAVGASGTVLTTLNGGTNWISKPSGVTATLRSVFMANDITFYVRGRAWAVGDNGVIIRTDDYGNSWTQQASGTTARLNKVAFGDSIRGAVFGDGGTILNTTDGGLSWHPQNSRTTENLVAGNMLPLSIKVENYYVMEMLAKRKTFFQDFATGAVNYDYFTKIDTGLVVFDPQTELNLRGGGKLPDITPYSFVIINNDSTRFKDHVKLGPGKTFYSNYSLARQPDTIYHQVLWDLLASGEIRLVKYYIKQTTGGQPRFLGFEKKVVEILRYGNFYPTTALYPPPEKLYLNNQPLGFIPEGSSVARYANDAGGKPADEQSSTYSFYISSDPIPGWFSQESRP